MGWSRLYRNAAVLVLPKLAYEWEVPIAHEYLPPCDERELLMVPIRAKASIIDEQFTDK
jgi:hypothetical protein